MSAESVERGDMSRDRVSISYSATMTVFRGLATLGLGREPKRFGTASDLADVFEVSKGTVSSAIRVLNSSGYITRDGTKTPYLGLTTKGERVLNGRDRLVLDSPYRKTRLVSVENLPQDVQSEPETVKVDRKTLVKLKAFLAIEAEELVIETVEELIEGVEL